MIEETILGGLLANEEFTRKVLPFLSVDYFETPEHKTLLRGIFAYMDKYNEIPTRKSLYIDISEKDNINEEQYKNIGVLLKSLKYDEKTNNQWLIDQTEKFCQDKAIYNAVRESILVLDNKKGAVDRGAIPKMLSDALAVAFDTNVGHDYLDQWEERFEWYHKKENKIPFDVEFLNNVTKGGPSRKSLCVEMAGPGVGKTLSMCSKAAANLMMGYNVLYITNEMAEERISERIDANLLDISLDDLAIIPKSTFETRIAKIKTKTQGKLKVKEYPTATANAYHFRFLLNELKMKNNFVPDIIYIDYINICTSSRLKQGAGVNSYTYIKAIAEELRGLAVETNTVVWTATQVNRTGFVSSDIGLEDTAESFGLPATADFMLALISTDELRAQNLIVCKQLKNRFGDIGNPSKFMIGVDRSKMRMYDVDQEAQANLNDGPVMDNTGFGERHDNDEFNGAFARTKKSKPSFEGLLD